MESGRFVINKEKGVVVYSLKSKGTEFVGVAKAASGDTFNEDIGKALAGRRVDLQIRKRDLEQVREVESTIREIIEDKILYNDESPKTMCKLWTIYLNDAIEVEKCHLDKIRQLKKEIECLEKGLPLPERTYRTTENFIPVYKNKK